MDTETFRKQTLTTGFWVALALTLLLYGVGLKGWAIGYLTGAFLSLFSAFSFVIAIPMLLRPGPSQRVKAALTALLALKLPIFMVSLTFGMSQPGASPLAALFGIALVPMLLTGRAIHATLSDSAARRLPPAPVEPKTATKAQKAPQLARTVGQTS